jgi:CBS domain-containing protein
MAMAFPNARYAVADEYPKGSSNYMIIKGWYRIPLLALLNDMRPPYIERCVSRRHAWGISQKILKGAGSHLMSIEQFMKTEVITIHPNQTVRQAMALLVKRHIGTLPVVDEDNHLVGLLRQADLMDLFMPDFVNLLERIDFVRDFGAFENARLQAGIMDRPVSNVMGKPISISRTGGLLRAAAELNRYNLLDLPVVDDQGTLLGLASWVDVGVAFLSRWLAETDPSQQDTSPGQG